MIFLFVSIISQFFRSLRVTLISKDSKLIASIGNCITFTFAAATTKFIASASWASAIIIEAVASFTGCYLSMLIYEKCKKNY